MEIVATTCADITLLFEPLDKGSIPRESGKGHSIYSGRECWHHSLVIPSRPHWYPGASERWEPTPPLPPRHLRLPAGEKSLLRQYAPFVSVHDSDVGCFTSSY